MTTINDKISLIIDTDSLFGYNDIKVQSMVAGDSYLIDELYKDAINMIKKNKEWKFKHIISDEIMTLEKWMMKYKCNLNDPISIIIFLRLATEILI